MVNVPYVYQTVSLNSSPHSWHSHASYVKLILIDGVLYFIFITAFLRCCMVLGINCPLSLFIWALFIFTTIVIALAIHGQVLDDYGDKFPQE